MGEAIITRKGGKNLSFITATAGQILTGYTGSDKNGNPVYGGVPMYGWEDRALNCGQSYYVQPGWHAGGTISANSLASQTSATASATQIASGYTAWVNGNRLTGTLNPTAFNKILFMCKSGGGMYYACSNMSYRDHPNSFYLLIGFGASNGDVITFPYVARLFKMTNFHSFAGHTYDNQLTQTYPLIGYTNSFGNYISNYYTYGSYTYTKAKVIGYEATSGSYQTIQLSIYFSTEDEQHDESLRPGGSQGRIATLGIAE